MRWLHLLGWVAAVGALLPLLAITRSTTATACQFNDYICPQPWCMPQLQELRGEMCRMDNTSLPPACCEGWCAIFSCEPNTDPHCGQVLFFWFPSGTFSSGGSCSAPLPGSACRDADYTCE